MRTMRFKNRQTAAVELAKELKQYNNPLILAIPRGGVPIGQILAEQLHGDLDLVLVHKFGFPDQAEFALGAVTEDGSVYLGLGAERFGLSEKDVEQSARKEIKALREKRKLLTPHRPPFDPANRTVVIVDDGIATGATMQAAVRAMRDKNAHKIIVAAPVASQDALQRLAPEAAAVHVLFAPEDFFAVSQFYDEFDQVSDAEVVQMLSETQKPQQAPL